MSTDVIFSVNTSSLPPGQKRSSSDFTVVLGNNLRFDSLKYNLCLLKLNSFYAIFNFNSSLYGNTVFTITHSGTPFTINIPNGIYNFDDFNLFMTTSITTQYGSSVVSFNVNRNTGKLGLIVTSGYTLTLSTTSLVMFGLLDKTTLPNPWWSTKTFSTLVANTYSSTFVPEWNMSIISLNLNCSIVTNSLSNGNATQTIANFSPLVSPFEAFTYEPINLTFLQINTHSIQKIDFKITDQDNNLIFNNDEFSFVFVIRPFGSIGAK